MSRTQPPGPSRTLLRQLTHELQNDRDSRRARPEEPSGRGHAPIYQTSTFGFRDVGQPGPYDYSRSGNPTRAALEECLAALEGGRRGFAFATGMAAETTALMLFSSGDRILVQNDLYGGTYRLFETVFRKQGITAEYVDLRDLDALRAALATPAAAIWIETPPIR